jgi:crotonobetainyl-CoA:carnitine CoA-transferase CaiB-like acyl-CoA transferase
MNPEPAADQGLPLSDVRVIAIEQYGAGPFGSLQLAELGAEVIKIEDPKVGGDIGRYVPPYQEEEDSLFFEALNRNKRSLALDLRSTSGKEVLRDLVRVSDAVYSNLKGDGPERLGLRFVDLRDTNPQIVCCSLSGFGTTGPRRAEPAYDYMIQAMSGWMSLTGEPGNPPAKTGPSLVDFAGGYVAAMALVVGIHAARRDGVGTDCDVSLFEVALSMLNYQATWHLSAGYEPKRQALSAHPSLVPFQNFETSDGWITICCPKQKFWRLLCEGIERPDLATDARFSDFASRRENREVLLSELSAEIRKQPTAHWLADLTSRGVPVARISTVDEALVDPQVAARDIIIETDHPRFGKVLHLRGPVRIGQAEKSQRPAPLRGADSESILGELLGYTRKQQSALRRAGAFGEDVI